MNRKHYKYQSYFNHEFPDLPHDNHRNDSHALNSNWDIPANLDNVAPQTASRLASLAPAIAQWMRQSHGRQLAVGLATAASGAGLVVAGGAVATAGVAIAAMGGTLMAAAALVCGVGIVLAVVTRNPRALVMAFTGGACLAAAGAGLVIAGGLLQGIGFTLSIAGGVVAVAGTAYSIYKGVQLIDNLVDRHLFDEPDANANTADADTLRHSLVDMASAIRSKAAANGHDLPDNIPVHIIAIDENDARPTYRWNPSAQPIVKTPCYPLSANDCNE